MIWIKGIAERKRLYHGSRYWNRSGNSQYSCICERKRESYSKNLLSLHLTETVNEVKAIGEEARLMLGRTPGNIIAVRPLRQGVISDYTVTEKMIKYFVQKALGRRTFRNHVSVSVCQAV